MKNLTFLIIILFQVSTVSSQMQYDKNWLMGYNCCAPDGYEGMKISFNQGVKTIEEVNHGLELNLEGMTLSNTQGELLFYLNGCQVFDASYSLMENGDSLNFGVIHQDYCTPTSSYPSGPQSIIALPELTNDSIYYLFHKSIRYAQNPLLLTDSFYLTTININENSGLGKIIKKNEVFDVDTFRGQQITAIKHQNNSDWWINTPLYIGNGYKNYLLSEGQIIDTVEQTIGPLISAGSNGSGHSMFSHDGSHFYQYLPTEDLIIFDFDRSTGLFSNPIQIEPDDDIEDGFGGIALSPNGRFLYVNSFLNLHQYDLEAEDIKASEYLVAEFDGFSDPFPVGFFRPQLGLDCKIYMATFNGTKYLHVINNPDSQGAACNFVQRGIELPWFNSGTMPHYPNYRLDTDFPLCTPEPESSTETTLHQNNFNIYPNPVSSTINLQFEQSLDQEMDLIILDNTLRIVLNFKLNQGQSDFQINLEKLKNGFYFYQIKNKKVILKSDKFVIAK